jgi:two-component system phosphate regulon sensor histidine kinase PhoR
MPISYTQLKELVINLKFRKKVKSFFYFYGVLQTKNTSPSQLAFLTAVAVSLVTGLIVIYFTKNLMHSGISFLLLFIFTYYLVYFILEKFIYRKIKLIYKFISQTKATKREEFYNSELLPQKSIDEVKKDAYKWAEERENEIKKLESNVEFRKQFLMNLAHELKTPIFATQGYIETLLAGAMNDEKVKEVFLQNASKSIDRLAELVDDLDEISKLESNQIPILKSEFLIQELIKEVFEELSFKSVPKKIDLSIKKGCEKPISVFADRQKIKQVLVNLIENSIKYGKENGSTTAGIYEVDRKTIFIEITDDGAGILEEHVPRVFERFYRTDTARSRNVGGTGLGLAIVKHIIEAHNHTVSCRSTIDVGSSFGFTLDKKQ